MDPDILVFGDFQQFRIREIGLTQIELAIHRHLFQKSRHFANSDCLIFRIPIHIVVSALLATTIG